MPYVLMPSNGAGETLEVISFAIGALNMDLHGYLDDILVVVVNKG